MTMTRKRKAFNELEVRRAAFEKYSKMSNDELMDEFMSYSSGDDYGGEYTMEGWVIWEVVYNEMMDRLKLAGFLSDSFVA